ncbi:MAG: hypothetical protein AAGC46_04145 [Solirubrobacteraceae bacterium]|nr:hypothetical protein [Patulibacter sp.]
MTSPSDPSDEPTKDEETLKEQRKKQLDEADPQPGEHDPDFDPTIQYRGVPNDGRIDPDNA